MKQKAFLKQYVKRMKMEGYDQKTTFCGVPENSRGRFVKPDKII